MDRHMDNKHADKLIVPAGSSGCLADLCNVLGCGAHGQDACARANGRDRGEGCAPCDKDEMAWRQKRCKTLFNRYTFVMFRRLECSESDSRAGHSGYKDEMDS